MGFGKFWRISYRCVGILEYWNGGILPQPSIFLYSNSPLSQSHWCSSVRLTSYLRQERRSIAREISDCILDLRRLLGLETFSRGNESRAVYRWPITTRKISFKCWS